MSLSIVVGLISATMLLWGLIGSLIEERLGHRGMRGVLLVFWPFILALIILFSPFFFGSWLGEVLSRRNKVLNNKPFKEW